MDFFVNRETELRLINDSFSALLNKEQLLRTPIIEVNGVGGIGKTTLLRQVEQRCHDSQLPYIWVDVSQKSLSIAHEIIKQVRKYTQEDDGTLEQSPVHAARTLLKQGPTVMLFDSVDMANTEQFAMIETLLRDLIDDDKLFVVLASKKTLSFQQERTVIRKLTPLLLKPFDRRNCEFYFDHLSSPIEAEIRNIIFEWTRGYPLAMNVMTRAISRGLDPRTEQGQREMLSLLTLEIIHQEVLANTRPEERDNYQTALQLFSVPRRFNLPIMQDLIEKFAPQLKRESSLAYFGFPKEIIAATNVLSWNLARAGFSVDEPIRSIFLLLLKIEQPDRYFAIHDFLAQANLHLAVEVPGSDRARYVRESLYHIACDTRSPRLSELLAQALQIILQEPPEIFLQFSEEFLQDKELQEVLGSHLATVQSAIQARLVAINTNISKG